MKIFKELLLPLSIIALICLHLPAQASQMPGLFTERKEREPLDKSKGPKVRDLIKYELRDLLSSSDEDESLPVDGSKGPLLLRSLSLSGNEGLELPGMGGVAVDSIDPTFGEDDDSCLDDSLIALDFDPLQSLNLPSKSSENPTFDVDELLWLFDCEPSIAKHRKKHAEFHHGSCEPQIVKSNSEKDNKSHSKTTSTPGKYEFLASLAIPKKTSNAAPQSSPKQSNKRAEIKMAAEGTPKVAGIEKNIPAGQNIKITSPNGVYVDIETDPTHYQIKTRSKTSIFDRTRNKVIRISANEIRMVNRAEYKADVVDIFGQVIGFKHQNGNKVIF